MNLVRLIFEQREAQEVNVTQISKIAVVSLSLMGCLGEGERGGQAAA